MLTRHLLIVPIALLACACSNDEAAPPKPVTPLDLSTVGRIQGIIQFEGPVPPRTELRLGSFADCAKQHQGPTYADDALIADGKVQNVLVYVKEGLGDRGFAVPQATVDLDQQGCVFVPHVAGAQLGQPVRFMNSDPLAHNVHGTPSNSSGWNFNLGVKGATRTINIAKPENVIDLKCDVHPWMRAYLGVFDHPYFAVTGSDGRFELPNLPAGTYVIEAWHERFGRQSASVTVGQKQTVDLNFSYKPS